VDIDIRFNGEENRKLVEVKVDRDRRERFPLYFDGETVAGRVSNYFWGLFIFFILLIKFSN
jgi:vacuolar protein sorting-associated protein 26